MQRILSWECGSRIGLYQTNFKRTCFSDNRRLSTDVLDRSMMKAAMMHGWLTAGWPALVTRDGQSCLRGGTCFPWCPSGGATVSSSYDVRVRSTAHQQRPDSGNPLSLLAMVMMPTKRRMTWCVHTAVSTSSQWLQRQDWKCSSRQLAFKINIAFFISVLDGFRRARSVNAENVAPLLRTSTPLLSTLYRLQAGVRCRFSIPIIAIGSSSVSTGKCSLVDRS